MKIALYSDHLALPFWYRSKQPTVLFSQGMSDWTTTQKDWDEEDKYVDKKIKAKDFWVWPILIGIEAIDLPLMAHLSVFFDAEKKTFSLPKRVWIQITTLPEKTTPGGIPVVVENGNIQVANLWCGDSGTRDPYQLIEEESAEGNHTATFWTERITNFLSRAKQEAVRKAAIAAEEAILIAERYAVIP